jgi:DNA-binding NtrC family response regulator
MAKALIVSNDDSVRYLYEVAIAFQKIEVQAARTISEAVKKILIKFPDLLILDLETINLDDISALKEVKKKRKTLPLIIMTELPILEAKKQACVLGACKVLAKKDATIGNLIKTTRQAIKK